MRYKRMNTFKSHLFPILSLLFFFQSLPVFTVEPESTSRIGLFPFLNESQESQYDFLCSTMADTLLLNFNIMNRFIVEQDLTFNPYLDEKETERYFNFSKYDYAIYGRVFRDDESILILEVIAYDRANQVNIIFRQEKIINVFYIFKASDILMEEVIDVFSVQHLGFGSLLIENQGEQGRYQVLINDQNAGWNIRTIPKLLVGKHQLVIRQDRMLGEVILLDRQILIKEDETASISFSIPYLTESETYELHERETFIKENWNVIRDDKAFEETFQELFDLMSDVSYCDRLTRKVIEYEMWKEIYDNQGEIPGVKKGVRMIHNYFSVSMGYSFGIPLGQSTDIFNLYHGITLVFSYNINRSWGVIGMGVKSGAAMQSTKETENVMYPFQMISVPLGGFISYSTHFNSPFFATAGLSSGVSINSINYHQLSTERIDGTVTNFYLEPFAGGGYYFSRNFGMTLLLKTRMVFFEDIIYSNLAPGLELFIHL